MTTSHQSRHRVDAMPSARASLALDARSLALARAIDRSRGAETRVRRCARTANASTMGARTDGATTTRWRARAVRTLVDWAVTLVVTMVRAKRGGACGRGVGRGPARWLTRRAADADEDAELAVGALVTGWSSGLGRASALALAREGYAIAVPYRLGGVSEAHAFARACRREAPETRVELVGPLDLASERDVGGISLVELRRRGVDVRVVVHCAAVFADEGDVEGRSLTATVNFHNVALLTDRLVQEMTRASRASPIRVVFVGSFVHRCSTARALGFEAFERWLKSGTSSEDDPTLNYMWSKVAISAYAVEKHRIWQKEFGGRVSAVLLDPGLIDTRLVRHWPKTLQVLYRFFGKASGLMQAPSKAARGVVLAVSREPTSSECPQMFGSRGALTEGSFWTSDKRVREACVSSSA